ncbi:MAG: (2Fe-2S)-binding protein [Gemmatimonadetes bacterium]|nr:(2Fe-2S)-binding protein [Gemmatimonadota bacterium]
MTTTLTINGQTQALAVDPDTPLLWALRDTLGLTGTKFGCGVAQCGACTVHLDGQAVRSCAVTVGSAAGRAVTTIEGATADTGGDPVARACADAWVAEDVAQCGYCQPGMVMAVAALLRATPDPTDAQLDAALTNVCRCGSYPRLRLAVHRAARTLRTAPR